MILALWFLAAVPAGEWQPLFERLPEGAEGWGLSGGVLHAEPSSPWSTADLMAPPAVRDFEFRVEYRVSPGGNSGIRYLPLPRQAPGLHKSALVCLLAAVIAVVLLLRRPYLALLAAILCLSLFLGALRHLMRHPLALEFQVLDNERHRDGKRGAQYRAGALYGLSPATEDASRPAGEWNEALVRVCGTRIEHWLNGRRVVEVDIASPAHRQARERFYTQSWYRIFKESEWSRLGWTKPSLVGLQHHGEEVWFRGARIRELSCESPPVASRAD